MQSVLAQSPQGQLHQQLQSQLQTQMTAQVQTQMMAMAQMQAYGPFPPPALIKEYEVILPGSFERIMKMAEKAQNDQADTVKSAQQAQGRDSKRVHWMALAISLASVVGAVVCAWLHQTVIGTACLGVPVLAVAQSLIASLTAPKRAQQAQAQQQTIAPTAQPTVKPTSDSGSS